MYCNANRLAPDLPIPILEVLDVIESPGMARNVHRNILQLTKHVDLVSNSNWRNITKTRYVHKNTNHTFFRVDTPINVQQVNLQKIDFNYEMIVVSDYNKGFLTESSIEFICSNHDMVLLDTKKKLGDWASKAKFIKINHYEYTRSEDFIKSQLSEKIIHTAGAQGAFFQNIHFPVDAKDVRDTSGAGDVFLSALAVKYIESSDITVSIQYANSLASKAVAFRGVTSLENILSG